MRQGVYDLSRLKQELHPFVEAYPFHFRLLHERLLINALTRGLKESIGYRTASRRQCRLTQAGRADTIIDKVHLHFRDFLDADQAICVEILLFGFTVPEGKVAV